MSFEAAFRDITFERVELCFGLFHLGGNPGDFGLLKISFLEQLLDVLFFLA